MKTFDEFSSPTPTTIRIVRRIYAPRAAVWRAHTDPEVVKRWMTGPPDHSLSVCEIDLRVGGRARYVWKSPEFEMGMTAEYLEVVDGERIVHTEEYEGWPEGRSTVSTRFAEADGATTVTIDIEYGSPEAREQVMQPGFEEGYAASYASLDALLPELG